MPNISIITISYNEERSIKKTIDSVLGQTYKEFEYIVVDGKSTDFTFEIEKEMLSDKPFAKIISEPDRGIYDAMNKGIEMADGKWMIFLNSGDFFANRDVLANVSKKMSMANEVVGIFYGDAIYQYKKMYKVIPALNPDVLEQKMAFCHQCAVVRSDIMRKYKYDERYSIAADYDFFLRTYLDDVIFCNLNMAISIFQIGGISTRGNELQPIEHLEVQHTSGIYSDDEYIKRQHILKKSLQRKENAMRLLPKSFIEIYRVIRLLMDGYRKKKPMAVEW